MTCNILIEDPRNSSKDIIELALNVQMHPKYSPIAKETSVRSSQEIEFKSDGDEKLK